MTKKALKICFEAHKEQVDKSGMPYVFHPFHLAEQMETEDAVIVALLHDVVEDTEYTLDDIKSMGFPDGVIDALSLLTHDETVPYMDYVKKIKNNPIAKAVKLADLKHNSDLSRLSVVTEKDYTRADKYKKAISLLGDSQESQNCHFNSNKCKDSEHDFIVKEMLEGATEYICQKCGFEAARLVLPNDDFDKKYFGSIIDGYTYKWNQSLSYDKILKIELSVGDFPIKNYTFWKGYLKVQNKINGSRDGGLSYSADFFMPHEYNLFIDQNESVYQFLSIVDFSEWQTEIGYFDRIGACGYCPQNTFKITYDDGIVFVGVLSSRAPESFFSLANIFNKYTNSEYNDGFVNNSNNTSLKQTDAIVVKCCNITVPKGYKYCPKCGKKITECTETKASFDFDETMWICKCGASASFIYEYCPNCGEKR